MPKDVSSTGRKSPKKKAGRALRSVTGGAVKPEAILDLIEKLGLADLIVKQVKARVQDVDVDELFDDVTDYMRRNPEVLVVTLGALTLATGLAVWISSRREWDGRDRRRAA